jgi:cytochrome b
MAHVENASVQASGATWVRIWDPVVRVAHWTVAVGFFTAYFTEDDALTLHVWAGYVVGIVVALRVLWGFVGPKHARFVDFVYRPGEVLSYLRNLVAFRGRRYLGHSPAGGTMVVVLLIGLLATVGTGLVLHAVRDHAGPLAGIVVPAAPTAATAVEQGEDEHASRGSRRAGAGWREVHELLANLMLVLVILHVGGVLLASYVHHENLPKAMITGDKRL